jgi:hypothetical protein
MPNPDRLLRTLHRAVDAFRATPGRRGHVIPLSLEATEVLVVGDLHGSVENFRLLLRKADLAAHPRRHLVVQELIHGPFLYPGGGDKSHQLLDLIAALKCQFPRQVHFLLGNHELAQWRNQRIGKGDQDLNDLFRRGVREAYGDRAGEVYEAYVRLFAVADLVVRTPNRVFISHTYPSAANLPAFHFGVLEQEAFQEEDLKLGGSVHSLVWNRDTSQVHVEAFLSRVNADFIITGHIPCDEGYAVPNDRQIILDAKGCPACFCLFPVDRPLTQTELIEGVGTL